MRANQHAIEIHHHSLGSHIALSGSRVRSHHYKPCHGRGRGFLEGAARVTKGEFHLFRHKSTLGRNLARRIGRNELTAIRVARAYVVAQRRYAGDGHDGRRPGLYARTFRSDPGQHNGLYWAAARGERRSPVGDLLSEAALERRVNAPPGEPAPFHGYYFRILTAQGEAAAGGAMDYIVGGEMSRGFALVAWPAQYDVTGVMTFVVSHEGTVYQGDLGPDTDARAREMTRYDPDQSWTAAD